jgi:hypothetical protein
VHGIGRPELGSGCHEMENCSCKFNNYAQQERLFQALAFLLILFSVNKVFAQHDSLILKNRDVIVGEIKSLDRGVLGS